MFVRGERIIIFIPVLVFLLGGFTGCSATAKNPPFDINSVKSYQDIPGVTNEEIAAIEAFKTAGRGFSYGSMKSTESFRLPDGSNAGFSALFCGLLSELFGIPFIQETVDWESGRSRIEDKSLDFLNDMTATQKRRQTYFMTRSIAERSLRVFFRENDDRFQKEEDVNGLKLGFYGGSVTAQSVLNAYPTLHFETVDLFSIPEIVESLASGRIDAFVGDKVSSVEFEDYPSVHYKDFFPLIYTSVSMTTGNPDLAPVISVVDKYIGAGGIDKLYELYKAGNSEFAKYELSRSFTVKERAYINDLTAKVLIALEEDNYPISFYNEREKKFQGIAPDILDEISRLTGIIFENVSAKGMSWAEILSKLRGGKISLVSELLHTEDRKDDFIWAETPYASSRYALLSKSNYPSLEMYQVARATVGVCAETAYDELYRVWFPERPAKLYVSFLGALKALEKGEIDLMMWSEYGLLTQTNLLEKPGYKINILFNSPVSESFFGFNKNEETLCSIISKSQNFVNISKIEKDWTSRFYDYSRKIANERYILLSVVAAVFFLLGVFWVILLLRNSRISGLYKDKMITLSAIYDTIPDLVYCMDTNCAFTSCNHSYEKFLGHSEAEIIGKTDLDLYDKNIDKAQGFMDINKRVINEKIQVTVEEVTVGVDNVPRTVEAVKTPLIVDGKVTGLLGISRDITEHKAAILAAKEASRAKSDFLAKMSHEIRTPMNAIIGMAELALREDTLNGAREHIMTVKQSGANLLSIINDILDFSKIETGKLEIIQGDYSFSSLVNDVISIIRMRVVDSQVCFVVNIDSNIPNALIGDEIRIRQVLINLLGNAVKFTEKGFVSFTVCGEITAENTVNLVLEIMDSGKGIKQEDMKHLFGEYVQFDPEKNKGTEGTGLGLAISLGLIKAMNGNITVHSEYGKGSSFIISLPQGVRSQKALASVENPDRKSVLIYELRDLYANSIIFAIDNLGVNCTLVLSDSEFYEELANHEYSFVFISFELYKQNKTAIMDLDADFKIVILTEFGETIPEKDLNVLAMPVHCISVANILNGESEHFSYSQNTENIVRFTATGVNILVVDDVITNLKVAKGLLAPYKMQVDLCKSGMSAIDAIKTNRYDLVFMDHRMPGMDGIEATEHIRVLGTGDVPEGGEDEYFKNVPIIALTANAVSGTKEMFLQNGFNDFLSKPIDTIKLNAVLEKWIPKEKRQVITTEEVENGTD